MLNRIPAVLLLALIFTSPCQAGQSPRAFLVDLAQKTELRQKHVVDREPVFMGKPVSKKQKSALSIALRYLGTKPAGMMKRLWCAQFLNMVERQAGRKGTGSNLALSYATYGRGVSSPRPGDIGVMHRKGGGHVAVFEKWAPNGRAVMISGNGRGGKVSRGQYAPHRIFTWRRPA